MKNETLYFVMPCYNEEQALEHTIEVVDSKLVELIGKGLVADNSGMLFSDDGSSDRTWEIVERAHASNPRVKASRLAGNRGKEYALFAGLMEARPLADIVICMDADLQHDIDAVEDFLAKRAEGYELVYGVKASRAKEPFIRNITARFFAACSILLARLAGDEGVEFRTGHVAEM